MKACLRVFLVGLVGGPIMLGAASKVAAQPMEEPVPGGDAVAPPAEGDAQSDAQAQKAAPEPDASEPVKPPEAPNPKLDEARQRIARGERLYSAGDYEAALVELQRALDLLEDHPARPLVLYNIGKTYEKLFRYEQAMRNYRAYLEGAGEDAPDRADVQAKVDLLESLLATLRIEVDVRGYEVWVDEHLVGTGVSVVLVPGGTHVVEVRKPGYEPARAEAQLPSGTERTLRFDLEPLAKEFEGAKPVWFWVTAASATALLAAGGVAGGVALKKRNDVDAQIARGDGQLIDEDARRSEIQRLSITADILFVAGAAFGIGATVLAFIIDWDSPAERDVASGRWRLTPTMGPGVAGLSFGGAF